jgi:hypothetical protein
MRVVDYDFEKVEGHRTHSRTRAAQRPESVDQEIEQ